MWSLLLYSVLALVPLQNGSSTKPETLTLHFQSGKTLEGKVLRRSKQMLILRIEYGILEVDLKRVVKIEHGSKAGLHATEPELPPAAPGGGGPAGKQKPQSSESSASGPGKDASPGAKQGERSTTTAPAAEGKARSPSPAETALPKPLASAAPGSLAISKTGHLMEGRIVDRYDFLRGMAPSTTAGVGIGLLLLFWGFFSLGWRVCDVAHPTPRRLGMATIWLLVVIGVLLIPDWTPVLAGAIGFCILVTWHFSARGLLGAKGFESLALGVLGLLAIAVLFLIVEVSQHLVALPSQS